MNEPGRFRKRPVEVEAIRWTGDNTAAVKAFVGTRQRYGLAEAVPVTSGEPGFLTAADVFGAVIGDAVVYDRFHEWIPLSIGDWVIRGLAGEFYPHDGDVFARAYEAVATWYKRGQLASRGSAASRLGSETAETGR